MIRSVRTSRFASVGLLLLLPAILQCGTDAVMLVRVSVSGLENTEANRLGANTVELETFFRRGVPVDAGSAAQAAHGTTWDQGLEARRVVYWDGARGPFSFFVQLPIEAYTGVRVEARIARRCGDSIQYQLIAEGSSNTPFMPSTNAEVSVSVALEQRTELCQ